LVAEHKTNAAGFVHEESSYLSKMIAAEASKKKLNILFDGTGDSGLHSLKHKIELMTTGGHKLEAVYATCPTEVALQRALDRAKKTGRYVIPTTIKAIHATVSETFPEAVKEGLFPHAVLYDTRAESGKPVKIAEAFGKKLEVFDHKLWKEFLAKAEPHKKKG
jgi:hypothetical protein